MIDIFNYLFEFSLCLFISWSFYKLVLERLTFFDLNRNYLLVTLVISLVIPLLSFDYFVSTPLIPEMTLPAVWVGGAVSDQVTINLFAEMSWQEGLLLVYGLGVLFMSVQFFSGLLRSFRLLQKAKHIQKQGVAFAIHPEFQPASFFHYVLLPEFLPEDPDQQQIVIHESIHVSKHHTLDLLLIQATKVILWFNPIVYLFEKSLREVHEFQADQGVTKSHSPFDYSRLLVRLISGQKSFDCIHYFSRFQTKKRIIMMNKAKSTNSKKRRFLLFLPLLGVLVFAFACENQSTEEDVPVIMENPDNETIPDKEELFKKLPIIEETPADDVFDVVEQGPMPVGGLEVWMEYLTKNLNYPKQARQAGIEGIVMVAFVVNKDGSISDAFVEKGIGAGCDEESLRVINEAADWSPGMQKGKEVRVRMRFPINFKLDSDDKSLSSSKLFQHRFAGFDLTPQGMRSTEARVIPSPTLDGC